MLESLKKNLRKIPSEYRRWSIIGVLAILLLALPVMVVGLTTGRFELRKRAASGEVTPIPSVCNVVLGVIEVTPLGSSGTCHDIQTAIDAARENDEVHVHAGNYEIPIRQVEGKRIGLYINKKIFFEADYPNTRITIRNADIGVFVDRSDVSISGWIVSFKDIIESGVFVQGGLSNRYVYLGVLELNSEGSVPKLIGVQGFTGVLSSGGGRSGIYDSKLKGAEHSAIELIGVNEFDIKRNTISDSTLAIRGYDHGNDMRMINIEENTISHVRGGIVFWVDDPYRLRDTYIRKNNLFDFGFSEYFNDYAEKYHITSQGGMNIAYGTSMGIGSNTLVNGGGVGIFLQGGGNIMVEKNLIVNNRASIGMSGGTAAFINNTIDGNSSRNGGGVSITRNSSFINNIVTNVGNFREDNVIEDYCGLTITNGGCSNFSDSRIRHNDYFNVERTYCASGAPVQQCSFTYGQNGNISADPLFGPDYCLRAGSPAIYGNVALGEYMGHRGSCGGVVPTSTSTPTPSSQVLRFKLKFAGVTSRPVDDSVKEVLIFATSSDGGPAINYEGNKMPVQVRVDDSGIYHGEISLAGYAFFGHHYRLRVKGPKHLQKVFRDVVFQPETELDLTGQPLRPGDLNLDGKVDFTDLQLVNSRMFSQRPEDVTIADVNFDRRVDIIDRTLVLNTLSVQYDPD